MSRALRGRNAGTGAESRGRLSGDRLPEPRVSEGVTASPKHAPGGVTEQNSAPIRGRAAVVALLGVVPLALFVQWSDMQVGGTMAAGPFPPLGACLLWAILLGVNTLAARHRRPLLTGGELLVVLSAWVAANMVAGRGLLHPLLSSLAGPVYYARTGAVKAAAAEHLPAWLAIADRHAAAQFFEGYHQPVPWALWRGPLGTWALFLIPFVTAGICLSALFERAWVRHERLAFPLVALPLEGARWLDTHAAGPAFRRAFAAGLAVPLLLHGFGVANAYMPAIPCVPFFNDVSTIVSDPPWTAARPLYLNLYPLLIGLTFLAPTDVTLSVWFFLLLHKAQMVVTAAAGWNDGPTGSGVPTAPYVEEQSAGAFLALAALLVWSARNDLRRIASGGEGRSGRLLFAGFVLSVLALLGWCVWTGLPLWLGAGMFGFYLAVALVLGRLMAEGGISWILAPILPDKLLLSLTGSAAVSPVVVTRLMLHVQHLRDTRQMLAPAVLQTGRLRDAAGCPPARFYGLLLAAVLLALVVGGAAALPQFYRFGALTMAPLSDGLQMSASVIPTTAVGHASARLSAPIRPSSAAAAALAVGALVTWALSALRTRFLWWPLHPLGYALTGTLQLGYANKMLLSVFLGWALKTLALRFGGAPGFRLLRGAAMGLVLGDLLMGGVLKLLDWLLGPGGYAIF